MPKQTTTPSDAPHFPRSAPIDAYGKGGFAFSGMSHRGSLLCLPRGVWAWPVTNPAEIDEHSLARVLAFADEIDTLIVGSGADIWIPPRSLRDALRTAQIGLDVMQTGPAIRTYNIMVGERRRVAAALIAVP
ncbi:MAG TPA: Mth938-like domain-containing protein [Bradyrhizobium sp.]|nr:Mth938-like domain-containing protein [Bradyrhizobium sp.]